MGGAGLTATVGNTWRFAVRIRPIALVVSVAVLVAACGNSSTAKATTAGDKDGITPTEIHVGGEYFFAMKVPFALRAGWWRDPAHSIEYRGPLALPDAVAAAILYPKGAAQNHVSVGGGFAWPRFQIDAAYDTSKYYKVGSLSAVVRF